jgi:putative ABC transport system permease protein
MSPAGRLEELRHDLIFSLRQLRRSPAFTLVAATTLALGIGANSAIFALVDAAVLRPLPFPDPDRLVMVWERSERSPRSAVSPLNMADWNERNRAFESIAGFVPNIGGMVMDGRDGAAETVTRQWVTAGFFDVLGVEAIAGRTLRPEDEAARSNVVVLSEALWQTRFDRDAAIVGRDIRLDGMPFMVVGIVPKDFQFFERTSMWAMIAFDRRPALRGAYVLRGIGRMKRGVTIEAARAEMATIAEGLAREFPDTNKGRRVTIEPMHDALIGSDLRTTSMLFLGVVGFVLAICCANVANLLLTRATARTREFAIRSALGASRRRVIRLLVTESLMLSAIGGALGLGVGAAILAVASSVIPQGLLPGAITLAFDARVVAFSAGAAILVGVLFGLVPAWQAAGFSSAPVMASGTRTSAGGGGTIRALLVAGEVAIALLLLVGAGLLLRTLLAVEGVDRGYRADRVLTMMVDPLGARYPTRASLLQFFDDIEREVSALPGVRSMAWTTGLPLGPSDQGARSFETVGAASADSQRPTADYQIVSPTYFQTLDVPIVAGRAFNDRDNSENVAVCIVNEAVVRGYLHGRSPIGMQLAIRPTGSPQAKPAIREIVGVARQVKGRPDELEDFLQIYVPMAQNPIDDIYLAVQSTASPGNADALTPSVRAAIARVDKEQLVSVRDVMTLEDVAWHATSRQRFRAVMVIAFASLALLLAIVGVFGILGYSVQLRVRDFSVRRALGAGTTDLVRLAIGSAVRVIVAGSLIGLILAAMLGRLLASLLFGVQPLDPVTFVSAPMVLALTAVLAMIGPAWRATRVDPAIALRAE